jgi:hypothetical protein
MKTPFFSVDEPLRAARLVLPVLVLGIALLGGSPREAAGQTCTGVEPIAFGAPPLSRSISLPGEAGCYSFPGEAGDLVRATAVTTSGTLNTTLHIFQPEAIAPGCGPTPFDQLDCPLNGTGPHMLRVFDFGLTDTGAYNVSFQRLNNPVGCEAIAFGAAPLARSIELPAEVDCYRFAGAAGDVVRAVAATTSGSLNTTLEILRPDGTTVPGCGPTQLDDLECPLDATGPHTLLMRDFLWDDGGTYNVSVHCLTPPCGSASPDLIETALTDPPGSAKVGDGFEVTDTVRNDGGAAGPSTTRYYLSRDAKKSSGDKRLTPGRDVPGLAPGAQSTGTVMAIIPPGTAAADYLLLACADDTRAVMESREDNNCRASETSVHVTGPDLVVTAVTNPPAMAVVGDSFSVTETVRNQGTETAGASTTRYYLSRDTKRGSDVRLDGTRPVGSLLPGASSTGTANVTISATTAPGTYFLLACADDRKRVPETNEKNNCRASGTLVGVTGP